jgi:hypothetical protein
MAFACSQPMERTAGNPFIYIKFPAIGLGVNVAVLNFSSAWRLGRSASSAKELSHLKLVGGVAFICWSQPSAPVADRVLVRIAFRQILGVQSPTADCTQDRSLTRYCTACLRWRRRSLWTSMIPESVWSGAATEVSATVSQVSFELVIGSSGSWRKYPASTRSCKDWGAFLCIDR